MIFKDKMMDNAKGFLIKTGLARLPVYMGGFKGTGEDLFGEVYDAALARDKAEPYQEPEELNETEAAMRSIERVNFFMLMFSFYLAYNLGKDFPEESYTAVMMNVHLSSKTLNQKIDDELSFIHTEVPFTEYLLSFLSQLLNSAIDEAGDELFEDPELQQNLSEVVYLSGVASGVFFKKMRTENYSVVDPMWYRSSSKPRGTYRSLKSKKKKRR